MTYYDPINPKRQNIRVMPADLTSPYPCQQRPYVRHTRDGKALDKYGNFVDKKSPEAHIPIEEFVYRTEK